jgi:Putative prokaryotic signal transducing protein
VVKNPVKLVRVRAFSGPTANLEAQLARGILKGEGIPSLLPGRFSAEALPGIDVVQLLVREEDAAEAAQILEGFLDNPSGASAHDETALSPQMSHRGSRRRWT